MRYTKIFSDGIDKETVQELIDSIHDKENVDLIFSTWGGEISTMKHLISYLNSRIDVKVILTEEVSSAGTLLLTDFIGEVVLHESLDFILFHAWDRQSYSIRKGLINDSILRRQTLEENKLHVKALRRIGLTDKECKQIFKGKDVILYKKDFKRLKLKLT